MINYVTHSNNFNSVSQLIGNTPLLKLNSLSRETGHNIFVKCEHLNPGGSIKDRTALGIIQQALIRQQISKDSYVIEGTAGNTGIGLALLAHEFNFRCAIVMPNNQSKEKYQILKALGAELITVDPCPFTNKNHFYHTAQKIHQERKGSFWVNQFENTDNYKIHFETTGPEIFHQLNGQVDAFVSSVGTGGTIAGVSNFLKSQNINTHIQLIDPMGSGLYSYFNEKIFKSSGSSITEGIGIMRLTQNFSLAKVDSAVQIDDEMMLKMFRRLCTDEGLIVGTSAALNIAGAYNFALANQPNSNKPLNIVTILCDSGLRYPDKLFSHCVT